MKLGIIVDPDKRGFETAVNNGLSFIEICNNVGCDTNAITDEIPSIKLLCKETGVAIGSVGRWGTEKFDKAGSVIEEELLAGYSLIDAASELGSPVFNTGINYIDTISKYENINRSMDYFYKLIEYARPKGVKLPSGASPISVAGNSGSSGPHR